MPCRTDAQFTIIRGYVGSTQSVFDFFNLFGCQLDYVADFDAAGLVDGQAMFGIMKVVF
jgi:hypothetical protein